MTEPTPQLPKEATEDNERTKAQNAVRVDDVQMTPSNVSAENPTQNNPTQTTEAAELHPTTVTDTAGEPSPIAETEKTLASAENPTQNSPTQTTETAELHPTAVTDTAGESLPIAETEKMLTSVENPTQNSPTQTTEAAEPYPTSVTDTAGESSPIAETEKTLASAENPTQNSPTQTTETAEPYPTAVTDTAGESLPIAETSSHPSTQPTMPTDENNADVAHPHAILPSGSENSLRVRLSTAVPSPSETVASAQIPPQRIVQGGTLRLPNARQNQAFSADIATDALCRGLGAFQLVADSSSDLCLDEDGVLRGTPRQQGEFILTIHGTRADGVMVVIKAQWLVNPDPKTLWHNIEPTTALFRKPHQAFLHSEDRLVSMTAARVRGRSHAHKGSFCEDDIALFADETGYFGMVADGAGSSRFARLASQVLCESIPRHLRHELTILRENGTWDKLNTLLCGHTEEQETGLTHFGNVLANAVKRGLGSVLEYTQLSITEQNKLHPLTIRDLYSTCLCFWALPLTQQRWALASYWVGDGGLAVKHDDHFTLLGIPDGGEFSGQTRFLTAEETKDAALAKRLRTGIYHNLQAVWAMTDGITDAKFASEQQLERSEPWQKLSEDILPLLSDEDKVYQWLNFWSQGNHDDRSFCVLRIKQEENA